MINDAQSKPNMWEDDYKKTTDIFDTSKDKIKTATQAATSDKQAKKTEETALSMPKKNAFEIQPDEDEEPEMTEEAQQKAIEEQFQVLYDGDPELRKVLEKSDVSTFSVEEKYQIIEAYMQGGGAAGLQIELQEEEEEDMDEKALEAMSKADKKALEE